MRKDLFAKRPEIKNFFKRADQLFKELQELNKKFQKRTGGTKKPGTPSTRLGGSRKGRPTSKADLKTLRDASGKPIRVDDGRKYLGPSKFIEERNRRGPTPIYRDYNHPYYQRDEKNGAPPKIPDTDI